MQEKAIEEQMVAVKDVLMEPTMKTLSDDLVQTPNVPSALEEKPSALAQLRGTGVLGV